MKKLAYFMFAVFLGLLTTACAQKNITPPFTPVDLNSKVTSGEYVKKVDNFLVLFDDSRSMRVDRHWQSKVEQAKLVATNMNNTIPTLDLQSGMRIFGPKQYSTADGSPLQYGMTGYTKAGLGDTINSITTTGNNTPLSRPIQLANADLANTKGDIAVILISDGMENVGPPSAKEAKALKAKYGERVCIYTILIGDDSEGRAVMESIAKASDCGFATDADAVGTPEGMAAFVEKVFLKKAPKVAEPPAPQPFTVELKVEFDFDKSNIRPQYYKTLTEFGDFMREFPEHNVNLEGHTDSKGSDKYNMKLAQRRADSVRNFLLKHFKNIDPARLTAISNGESKPIDTNDTKEGRQRNRRVYATFTASK